MTGEEKLHRAVLPTRKAQEAYHRALEEHFRARGYAIRIVRVMGRWEIIRPRAENNYAR